MQTEGFKLIWCNNIDVRRVACSSCSVCWFLRLKRDVLGFSFLSQTKMIRVFQLLQCLNFFIYASSPQIKLSSQRNLCNEARISQPHSKNNRLWFSFHKKSKNCDLLLIIFQFIFHLKVNTIWKNINAVIKLKNFEPFSRLKTEATEKGKILGV